MVAASTSSLDVERQTQASQYKRKCCAKDRQARIWIIFFLKFSNSYSIPHRPGRETVRKRSNFSLFVIVRYYRINMWPADDWVSQNVCASFMLCPFVIGHIFVETPYLNMCFRHLEKARTWRFPCVLLFVGRANKQNISFSVRGRSLLAAFSYFDIYGETYPKLLTRSNLI